MQQEEQFYYKTPELTHRYELIQHLLEYSNHLILVQGEKDTGKTSLFQQLTTPDESSLLMIKLEASAHTNQSDILNAMVADMHATTDSFDPWGTSIEDFHNWLGRCHSKQQIPALLIDDIDLLDDELLDFIFTELCVPHEDTALHVCLFCEPSFLDLARKKGLEENESQSLHIIEMPNFNEKQTAQYLNHKFPDSESDLSVFDEKTVKQIHRISHGMPGRINVLAEQYLNDPAKEQPEEKVEEASPEKTGTKPNRAIIVVVVLLVILSAVMAYILNMSDLTLTDDETVTAEIAIELPKPEPTPVEETPVAEEVTLTVEDAPILPDDSVEVTTNVESNIQEQPPALEVMTTIEEAETTIEVIEPAGLAPAPVQDIAEVDAASVNETDTDDALDTIADVDIEAAQLTTIDETPGVDSNADSTVDNEVESDAPAITEIPVATDLLITGIEKENAETTAAVEQEVVPVAEQTPEPQQPNEISDNGQQTIDWLLQQDENKYVLQLIGAYEQPTIDAYVSSVPELASAMISFTTTNDGKPWFVVVFGLYENRQQAVKAIDDLPQKARATSPWPRPVKSIKALTLQQ